MKRKRHGLDQGDFGARLERALAATANGTKAKTATDKGPVSSAPAQVSPSSITKPVEPTGKPGVSGLPIAAHRHEIISALSRHQVLVLTGETGSGKSTQLPQYLIADKTIVTPGRRVAVTQPRRVAAITLARRVAAEIKSPLGKAATARVGYNVRFDANLGRANEVVYLTEGMLLQELLRDPGLREYGVVVVDEVHERGVNVDMLLGFLRLLVAGVGKGAEARKLSGVGQLKVVVMSATAEVDALARFYSDGFVKASGGSPNDGPAADQIARVSVQGRQYPVQVIHEPKPVPDWTDAALRCIFQVHCKEPMPGDMLVFMTGQETIQSLQRSVEEYSTLR